MQHKAQRNDARNGVQPASTGQLAHWWPEYEQRMRVIATMVHWHATQDHPDDSPIASWQIVPMQ